MRNHLTRAWPWRSRSAPLVLPLVLVLAASLTPAIARNATAAPRGDCAGLVAGQRVYDCANLLTPAEVSRLETQAAAVARAGAPTIVYLQVRDATADQTLQDAIELMNRWDVESTPGAHDGFVMFFDLQPGNLRHGHVALYAGQKHYQHGNLPQAELDRIRVDVMMPLLQSGETASGIAAGLQAVAHDLQYGPPAPPASQVVAANIGRVPFNVLSVLFAAFVVLVLARPRRRPPLRNAGEGTTATPAPPGDLPPAVVGALVTGRLADSQMEATVLDFGRRGLLAFEPTSDNKVQIRLLKNGAHLVGYEREVWSGLESCADSSTHTIPATSLADVRVSWVQATSLLHRELEEREWYDYAAAAARRRPFYAAGTVALLGDAVAIALVGLSQEAWASIGLVIFFASAIFAFARGRAIPDTTAEGELAASPWRAFAARVSDRAYQLQLDSDLPYIVALGLLSNLAPRLREASERGYAPSWFRARHGERLPARGFYPCWIAFHSTVVPTAGGSASDGYSGGGAAGGGGGSAGSF